MPSSAELFEELLRIVSQLRNPSGGCPWDLEQTHESLKQYLIEESYEVLDAIDSERDKLSDELGDVLLQVVLHAQIGKDMGTFSIDDVVKKISEKMVRRHPHVFGDVKVSNSNQVLNNWESNKKKELAQGKSIVDGVPKAMPALQRAQRIGEKAARIGFEWRNVEEVRNKVFEEMREFLEICCDEKVSEEKKKEEFGDILFALTQLSRRLKYNSEELLHSSTNKFVRRFKRMEEIAGEKFQKMNVEEMDKVWEEVKKAEE